MKNETFGPKALHSVDECAYSLGLCRDTIYKLMDSGRLEFVKIGARRLIPEFARAAFLASLGKGDAA